jgi:hypothetical protein
MNLIRFSYSILGLLIIASVFSIAHFRNNEQTIVGKWEEVSLEYEKVDARQDDFLGIDQDLKAEIWQHITLHQAEVWEFKPDHTVKLFSDHHLMENLRWNIKGRGHILELDHQNNRKEDYQIQEITDQKLVIHFNLDLQVRGIVKMTFKRIEPNHVAQIQ